MEVLLYRSYKGKNSVEADISGYFVNYLAWEESSNIPTPHPLKKKKEKKN